MLQPIVIDDFSMHSHTVDISYNFVLFRGFWIMKTTFSYFPGMFENPAPAKYEKEKSKYYEILTLYECVEK